MLTGNIYIIIYYNYILFISGHSKCVTKILWGGEDLIYSSSEDTLVKVWDKSGEMIRELKGHGHWVNTLCLNTDYALRTGGFTEKIFSYENDDEMHEAAKKKYKKIKGTEYERLVSGSDDFTLIMWNP